MIAFLARWVLNAISLVLVSRIVPGINIEDFGSALLSIAIIGLVNTVIKPILFFVTLPITLLTVGLFTFVLNGFMFMLASALVNGFSVDGLWSAILGSVVYSLISTVLAKLAKS